MPRTKRKGKPKRYVEDHGNGFMFVGTRRIENARRKVADYSDEPHPFAHPCIYAGVPSVFMSRSPGALHDGATSPQGEVLDRG